MKSYTLGILLLLLVGLAFPQKDSKQLFDKELTNFEIWQGVAHTTVEGLPEGTYQSDNVHNGEPIGLNKNLKNVFSIIEEEGELVLKITGEIYGAVTTKESFENYHLSIYFKWGDKVWEPRKERRRDSGILYHSYGDHGRFWKTWKTCLEYQVQETDLGDFIPLGGNTAEPKVPAPKVEIRGIQGEKKGQYDPNSDYYLEKIGYIDAFKEVDSPHGEWNHLELYVIDNDAVHVVNGEIVMVVENAMNPETNEPLTKGQIQLQSEAAECYYKNFTITPITEFPEFIVEQVRFK